QDIEIRLVGPKPGEKLYEELMNDEETRRSVELDRYFVVRPALTPRADEPQSYDGIICSSVEQPYNSANVQPLSQDQLATFLYKNGLPACPGRNQAWGVMRVVILGGDGYLGWPTAMAFAGAGHDVCAVDNYLRRTIARETNSEALMANPLLPERAGLFERLTGRRIEIAVGDCCDFAFLSDLVRTFQPEAVVHYAEQPSAPYSMIGYDEARTTLANNLMATFNVIWAVLEQAPACHIIKLGTMGEYGTPNTEIEEGWTKIQHKGRSDKFLFPRQAGSLYHTTKVLDTDLLWFYVRIHGLRVTDLMQGPVYGLSTD